MTDGPGIGCACYVGVDNWAGRTWYDAVIVAERPKRVKVRWIELAHIGSWGQWILPGDETWVPRATVQVVGAKAGGPGRVRPRQPRRSSRPRPAGLGGGAGGDPRW